MAVPPAAEGTLFTFSADARRNPEAAPVVERFRAENFEPAGYTLLSYAAVQAWAQAVEKAGSLELHEVMRRCAATSLIPSWAGSTSTKGRPHGSELGMVYLEGWRVRATGKIGRRSRGRHSSKSVRAVDRIGRITGCRDV